MKIAVCVSFDLHGKGGVETHILDLAPCLRDLGVRIDLFGKTAGDGFQSLSDLRPDHYDIFHTHGSSCPSGFLTLIRRRLPHQRHVHTLHGVSLDYLLACRAWFNWRCYWSTWIEGCLSRLADHVICVSKSIQARARQCFRLAPEKTSVIYNGHTPSILSPDQRFKLRRRFGLKDNDKVLLFVGRGEDRVKGADAIIAVLEKLHPWYPHLRLMAVPGSGFTDAPWLCRTGPIAHSEIAAGYRAADIFVNASLNEGLPLTVVEAMAASLPIIAAPVGGIPEIITHNQTGLLLRRDRSDLSDKIIFLLENPDLCNTLARNALAAVQRLTWSTLARQTLEVYKSVVTGN